LTIYARLFLFRLEGVPYQQTALVPKAVVATWDCDTLAAWVLRITARMTERKEYTELPRKVRLSRMYTGVIWGTLNDDLRKRRDGGFIRSFHSSTLDSYSGLGILRCP
jgi:hypothetical protein